ncbi:MAG: hypothetical protein FJZ47_03995 [Candidatus Tectomicrobia bacterium]|uniref:Uncharacterized protein n=1 Tax=Tectimicrobiota bacterium TaxID=2528274 RepID=A0A937W098_UNCTE|nr:hypothetical protein [Candidatus Tectomicrobia bacterium]
MAEAAGLRVEDLGLFTDMYQLTMAQSYLEHEKNRPATFSLISWVRFLEACFDFCRCLPWLPA